MLKNKTYHVFYFLNEIRFFIFLRDLVVYKMQKILFIFIFLYFCKTMFGKKKTIFLQIKTIQNKLKEYLSNNPKNKENINTKKKS